MDTASLLPLLERYRAEPYELQGLGAYERWALPFFQDPGNSPNPYLDITLQLEVTAARALYERSYAAEPGASFTAFLTWKLLHTLKEHTAFNLRCVEGTWYLLRNPPLFFPIAVGGKERFAEALIEGVYGMEWPAFMAAWRQAVDEARAGQGRLIRQGEFMLSVFIGNVPGLRFTGLTLHSPKPDMSKPFFYFGQRYTQEGRLRVPFAAKVHHSSGDLYVLDLLVQDFLRRCAEV